MHFRAIPETLALYHINLLIKALHNLVGGRDMSLERNYHLDNLIDIPNDLFFEADLDSIDAGSRNVYTKCNRKPSSLELAIQAELWSGQGLGNAKQLIINEYGTEVFKLFDYAQKKSKGSRRSGDNAFLHEHATQARVARAFGSIPQQLAIAHDAVEDNSDSIVDIEYYLWEQGTRKYEIPEEITDSLRLLTNIYRIILHNAEERILIRDKSYTTKLLAGLQIPQGKDAKEATREFLDEHRKKLDRKQLYFDEPYLRDIETVLDMIDIKKMSNKDALETIKSESELYSTKKLSARFLKRELESQQEFLDQSVERPLFERRFRFILNKMNVIKYSYLKAMQDNSRAEKQGVLLKMLTGIEDALELIGNAVGYTEVRNQYQKVHRMISNVRKNNLGIDDYESVQKVVSISRELCSALPKITKKIVDIKEIRESKHMYKDQLRNNKVLNMSKVVGNIFWPFDSLLIVMADVADQLVIRNQLMYLNALSESLSQKQMQQIKISDIENAKQVAADLLREKYRPYFLTLHKIIENSNLDEGKDFYESVSMNAYRQYVEDLYEAEKASYFKFSEKSRVDFCRGLMIVKVFDAVDNVRTAPVDSKKAIERLIEKTNIIIDAAKRLEDFYKEQAAGPDIMASIRGPRLVLTNELHASLIENAKMQAGRRDNLFVAGKMIPYLLSEAEYMYRKKEEYLK